MSEPREKRASEGEPTEREFLEGQRYEDKFPEHGPDLKGRSGDAEDGCPPPATGRGDEAGLNLHYSPGSNPGRAAPPVEQREQEWPDSVERWTIWTEDQNPSAPQTIHATHGDYVADHPGAILTIRSEDALTKLTQAEAERDQLQRVVDTERAVSGESAVRRLQQRTKDAEAALQAASEREEGYRKVLERLIPWAQEAFDGLEAESEAEREELWERLAGPGDSTSPLGVKPLPS